MSNKRLRQIQDRLDLLDDFLIPLQAERPPEIPVIRKDHSNLKETNHA